MAANVGFTTTFVVSNILATQVIAVGITRRITVGEDASVAGWPTTDYTVRKPDAAAAPRQVPIGSSYVFERERPYQPGDTAGFIQAVTAPTTFYQDEAPV